MWDVQTVYLHIVSMSLNLTLHFLCIYRLHIWNTWTTWTLCLVCWLKGISCGSNIWLYRPIGKKKESLGAPVNIIILGELFLGAEIMNVHGQSVCYKQFKLFSLFLIFRALFSNALCLPSYWILIIDANHNTMEKI